MITQLLQIGLLAGAFALGSQPLNRNAIGNEDGLQYLEFQFGLIPTLQGRDNPEVYSYVNFKINENYLATYELNLYDDTNTLLFGTNEQQFDISSWSINQIEDINFTVWLHRARSTVNPSVYCDTVTWSALIDRHQGASIEVDNFYQIQFDSDLIFSNNSDSEFYFVLPMDLIYSYFTGVSNQSYTDGYNDGFEDGDSQGYTRGFNEGVSWADNQSAVATTIFIGIIDVALLPINFFLACLNFEVFGINIGSMVTALLTIMVVIIIVRVIFSGGNKK